jgi:hypothetical protein
MNKCTEVVRLHLDEELKQTIEALAVREGRAVSEWIRVRLRLLVYGLARGESLMPEDPLSEGRRDTRGGKCPRQDAGRGADEGR